MPLSELARQIYAILQPMLPDEGTEITYAALVNQLGPLAPPNENLQPRDSRLDTALGELVTECRELGLPAIAAIVVRANERSPGAGYYPMAHPEAANDQERAMIEWATEAARVRQTNYPQSL